MPSEIHRAYEHYGFAPTDLRCEIRLKAETAPAPAGLLRRRGLGAGYSMRQRGPARVSASRDTVYTPKARVIAYGSTRQFGVFRCSSR